MRLYELIEEKDPAGAHHRVPVGFVNVVEAKEPDPSDGCPGDRRQRTKRAGAISPRRSATHRYMRREDDSGSLLYFLHRIPGTAIREKLV